MYLYWILSGAASISIRVASRITPAVVAMTTAEKSSVQIGSAILYSGCKPQTHERL